MRGFAAGVVALLLLAGCSGSASSSEQYQLGEFFISGPAGLSEETNSITIANGGEFPHTLVVTRANGKVVAASGLVSPNETVTLDLSLEAGSYQFTCRIVGEGADGELVDHYERGMHLGVSIGG